MDVIDIRRPAELGSQLEQHRRELTGHCQRLLGSASEAEDAVQETMVRAWRAYDRFEGRAALRSWLRRIATNVCIDMMRWPQRRARPIDLGPGAGDEAGPVSSSLRAARRPRAVVWAGEGVHTTQGAHMEADPAEMAAAAETVERAFVTALQRLPARQRAVLILREVLRWKAEEVAELLGTTVASVNSALQRARATLAASGATVESDGVTAGADSPEVMGAGQRDLLARYLDAFGRFDVESLVSLLQADGTGTSAAPGGSSRFRYCA